MPTPSPEPSLDSLLETSLSTAILPLGKSTLRDLLDSSSEPVTLATPALLHWCLDPCHQETHLWLEPLIRYVPFLQRLCVPSKQQKPTIYHTWPPHNPSVGWGTDHSIHLKGDHKAMKTTTCRKRPAVRRRRQTCACWIMLSSFQPQLAGDHQRAPPPSLCSSSRPPLGKGGHCSRLLATCLRWVTISLLCFWQLSLQK